MGAVLDVVLSWTIAVNAVRVGELEIIADNIQFLTPKPSGAPAALAA
jgi:hypothetical protein